MCLPSLIGEFAAVENATIGLFGKIDSWVLVSIFAL